MKTKIYEIICTIRVRDDLQFNPDEVARRVCEEIAGAVEDNRDTERDFEHLGTEIPELHVCGDECRSFGCIGQFK